MAGSVSNQAPAERRQGRLGRFLRSRDGAAAIEFAVLSIPYFIVIFAIIETFVAFAAEQLVANAVDDLSRRFRTGQLTASNTPVATFRAMVCDEVSILIKCSPTEAATPSRLYVDLRSYTNFASVPAEIPRQSSAATADLNTAAFAYAPGGSGTINVMRVYYLWSVTADIVRPYVTNLRPAGASRPSDYLIVSTAAYQNEQF